MLSGSASEHKKNRSNHTETETESKRDNGNVSVNKSCTGKRTKGELQTVTAAAAAWHTAWPAEWTLGHCQEAHKAVILEASGTTGAA